MARVTAALLLALLALSSGCTVIDEPRTGASESARAEMQRLYEAASERYLRGDYASVQRLATEGYELARRVGSREGMADHLNLLGSVHYKRGDYAAARAAYMEGAKAATATNYRLGLGRAWSSVGSTYYRQGEYRLALDYYERSAGIRRELGDPDETARALNDLANVHQQLGDYARALRLREEALGLWQARGNTIGMADALNDLAWTYEELGEYGRALGYLEQSLAFSRAAHMAEGIADNIEHIGIVQLKLDRAPEALARFREAAALFEAQQNPDETSRALFNTGEALSRLGRRDEAEAAYRRSLEMAERVVGREHPRIATSLLSLAALAHARGRLPEAERLARRALHIFETTLDPQHPSVAAALGQLAATVAVHRPAAARPLYERARRIHLAITRQNLELDDETQRASSRTATAALRAYLGVLARLAGADSTARADAFVVAEQIRAGAAQTALARAGARFAADDPRTRADARRLQALRDRRQAVRKQLADAWAAPAAERDAASLARLQAELPPLERELAALTDQLVTAFPRYRDLTGSAPIDLDGVRPLLVPGEALLALSVLDGHLLTWLVRPDRADVYRDVPIDTAALTRLVIGVRATLDQSANPDLAAGQLLPFDVAGSHALYRQLVAPLEDGLLGVRHLLIVPDDALLPLPFGALVTHADGDAYRRLVAAGDRPFDAAAPELADYARLPWLARSLAITMLPSASSLRTLRAIARTLPAGREPLIGLGDPVLQGGRGRRRGGTMRSRGLPVTLEDVRGLDRLPGTRAELMALARALGADPARAVYLGAAATKPTLMRLNAGGRLANARVLAFATHGLMAGDLTGLTEPALVLTPPARATADDDGLLGLADVLTLRLDGADWVVLSACNTAAGDGSGEALSGLARAFFFAGSPALLVSHWSVDDRATQALMTEVFRRYAADPGMARSEALRLGMLAVMEQAHGSTAYFAHPFAWAPFFLVGEGAAADGGRRGMMGPPRGARE